jgi:hypothetical protein
MIELKHVKVGMFNLPGLTFPKDPAPEVLEEMMMWCEENHCGYCSGPRLWSFKNEAQRDWFILRWIDHIPKEDIKEDQA